MMREKRAFKEMAARHPATMLLIEGCASGGIQLTQELQRENVAGLKGYTPAGDKQMRLWAHTAALAQGFLHLPKKELPSFQVS